MCPPFCFVTAGVIIDITEIYKWHGHTDLQMRKKKFLSINYAHSLVTQSSGCFLRHPVSSKCIHAQIAPSSFLTNKRRFKIPTTPLTEAINESGV